MKNVRLSRVAICAVGFVSASWSLHIYLRKHKGYINIISICEKNKPSETWSDSMILDGFCYVRL